MTSSSPNCSAVAPAADPAPGPAAPYLSPSPAGLASWADPEWLPFVGLLLVPALATLAAGDSRRAGFFSGTAVYLGVLKWVGWLALTRRWTATPRALLFPAELMAGLAVLAGWFYLRNALAFLWPASYGLVELAVLPWLAAALHLAAGLAGLVRSRPTRADLLANAAPRLVLYGGFAFSLTLALALRSGSLSVQHGDALFHAVTGRLLHNHGLLYRHPVLGYPLAYPSGLGAMTAVGMAVSPLSHAQLLNLQYTALLVAAPFLITTAAALLAGRPLLGLHLLAPAFLAFVPLYSLYPEAFGSSTGRQAAAPLLAAAVLLALVAPLGGPRALAALAVVNALLLALAAALNPACAPYSAVAGVLVLAVLLGRAWSAGGGRRWAAPAAQVACLVLVFGSVLLVDPFYRSQVVTRLGPYPFPGPAVPVAPDPDLAAPTGDAPRPGPRFAPSAAWRYVSGVNPLQLTQSYSTLRGTVWAPRWPHLAYIPLALGLTAMAVLAALALRRRGRHPGRDATPLLALAAVALALALGGKFAGEFVIGGLPDDTLSARLLWIYTGFLLLRCELLLVFTALAAAAAAAVILVPRAWGWHRRLRLLGPALAVALAGAAALAWYRGLPAGDFVAPVNPQFQVSDDDLRLVAWVNDHLPPEKGLIGLPASTARSLRFAEDAFAFPQGGAAAVPLFSRHPNYCFAVYGYDPVGVDAYHAHVRDDFDPAWLLDHNVRWFYLTPEGLPGNPGLAEAVRGGALRELHREGRSAVYEVVPR